MIRTSLLAVVIMAFTHMPDFATAQVPDSNDVAELKALVLQLRQENAQLKLNLETIRRELENLKAERSPTDETEQGAPNETIVVVIKAMRDFSDDGARQIRIGEIKKEIPGVQARCDQARKRVEQMKEKNASDKRLWDSKSPPYHNRRDGTSWAKPYSDQTIGAENLEKMKAESRLKRMNQELLRLQRGPTEFQLLVIGHECPATGDPDPVGPASVEYRVTFQGGLARRIQTKKPGDRISVKGRVTDADSGYIAIDATDFNDAK